MLTKVEVGVVGSGNYIEMTYGPDALSGYSIISVTGLEPPPSTISYSNNANIPGSRVHSTSVEPRNLVITIELISNTAEGKSVLDLRRDLYHAIPSEDLLRVRLFNDDYHNMRIDGYLETVESSMFSKTPTIQLSILCPSPYFINPSRHNHYDMSPGPIAVVNRGDVLSGLQIQAHISGDFNNEMRIRNDMTGSQIAINRAWKSGEILDINTRVGGRRILILNSQGRIVEHLIGIADITSGWPGLVRGENVIVAESGGTEHNWRWDLSYYEYFGGF